MRVKDLIQHLQSLDQDALVLINRHNDQSYYPIDEVFTIKVEREPYSCVESYKVAPKNAPNSIGVVIS